MQKLPVLKGIQTWGYGIGNFGFGWLSQMMASFFVFYATAVLGLPGVTVGILVGISVFWDAISDPIMGYISDITLNDRFGRRHLYLWIGTLGMALSNLLIWNLNSNMPQWLIVALLAFALMLIKTAMTIYGTPYTALGAELTLDHVRRTKVQSLRMTFFMIGVFFATAITMLVFFKPTALYPIGQLNPNSYRYMSLVSSYFLILSGLTAIFYTQHMIPALNHKLAKPKDSGVRDFFRMVVHAFKHNNLRVVIIGYLFTNLAAAILNGVGLHVYTYTFLMNNTAVAWIAGGQLLIAVGIQPFWLCLNKHEDKVNSIRLALALSMFASLYFTFCVIFKDLVIDHLWVLIPFVVFAGIGSGGLFTLPQAMVADTVDQNAADTGNRQEGVYYGALTLSYKLSQSLAIFILGILVDFIGFESQLSKQTDFTSLALGLIMGLGTLLMFFAARRFYKHYKITRKVLDDIHHRLLELDSIVE